MYQYKARVTRVVDGDTIVACVDLGFNIQTNLKFRMEGYDSPETWRPKSEEERVRGEAAKAELTRLIEGSDVVITCPGFGKYRWLGTVNLPESDISVNQMMIDAGHTK